MNTAVPAGQLINRMAGRFGVDEGKLVNTLKSTAFRVKDGAPTNEQMMALMVVADQYGLNPFTREIYAFPDKQNGIVPVVGVDGWSRIINSHPQFDGMDFVESEDWITAGAEGFKGSKRCPTWIECRIYRKDRSHPIAVREYLDEVYRAPFEGNYNGKPFIKAGPWQSHTKRMLRHKATIQAARMAFGFAGIYDPDEAERIREARDMGEAIVVVDRSQPREYAEDEAEKKLAEWCEIVRSGQRSPADLIAMIESKGMLTGDMKAKIYVTAQEGARQALEVEAGPDDAEEPEVPTLDALRGLCDETGFPEQQLADLVGATDFEDMDDTQRAAAGRYLAEEMEGAA